jgi:hypothetical protein
MSSTSHRIQTGDRIQIDDNWQRRQHPERRRDFDSHLRGLVVTRQDQEYRNGGQKHFYDGMSQKTMRLLMRAPTLQIPYHFPACPQACPNWAPRQLEQHLSIPWPRTYIVDRIG